MSLEQAILDRLEQRNGQIAQLQSTVHALERAADSQREHARQEQERLRDARQRLDDLKLELREEAGKRWNAIYERDALAQENTKLGARIERMEESAASAELLRKSLNDEITKRDHELRAHEKELAEQREEIRAIIETATYLGMTSDEGVGNFIKRKCIESEDVRDEIIRAETNLELVRRECEQIRREVPLESTREGLKNATVKIAEVTAQLGSAKGEAEEWLKQCNAARRQRDEVKAEARKETQRLSDLCAELQSKYESILTKTTDLGSYAMTLGRKEGEPLEMFMERQALRLAAHETKSELRPIENRIGHFAVSCTNCDELDKAKTERADAMERCIQLRAESESLRAELQGYRAGESEAMEAAKANGIQSFEKLGGFIWRQSASLRQAQEENAPLNKLYFTMRKHRDDCNISANAEPIYRAVDEASEAIKQLTA